MPVSATIGRRRTNALVSTYPCSAGDRPEPFLEDTVEAMLIDHETLRRVTRAILESGGSETGEAEIVI